MNSLRAEACKVAKEMAKEHGGKPADYMAEAWRTVKEEAETPEYDRRYYRDLRGTPKGLAGRLAKKGLNKVVETAKKQPDNFNMLKAPKDRPGDLGKLLGVKRTDPVSLPPKVADEVKRILKFW